MPQISPPQPNGTVGRYVDVLRSIVVGEGDVPGRALRDLFDAYITGAGETTDGTAYYKALAAAVHTGRLVFHQGPRYTPGDNETVNTAPATTDDDYLRYLDAIILAAVRAADDNHNGGLPLAKLARLTEGAMRETDAAWRWSGFGEILNDLEARGLITRHLNATELGDDLIVPAEVTRA